MCVEANLDNARNHRWAYFCLSFILLAVTGMSAVFWTLPAGPLSASEVQQQHPSPPLKVVISQLAANSLHQSELQQMECLSYLALDQLRQQGHLLPDISVDYTPSLPFGTTEGPFEDGEVDDHGLIDISDIWAPKDARIQASAVLRRINKMQISRDVVPLVFRSIPDAAKTSKAIDRRASSSDDQILESLRNLLAGVDAPHLTIHPPLVHLPDSATPTDSLLMKLESRIESMPLVEGNKATILIFGDVDEFHEFLQRISSPSMTHHRHHSWTNKTVWIHTNAFDLVQALSSSPENDGIMNFLDHVGFTSLLFFPAAAATRFTDADLRKFHFTLKSQACEVSSVHRALSFVETLKKTLMKRNKLDSSTGNAEANELITHDGWETWTLFIGGRAYRHAVDTIQEGPWVIDESLRLTVSTDNPDGAVSVTSSKSLGVQAEVITKEHLLHVYAPLVLKHCKKIGGVVIETKDPFTLKEVHKNFTKPEAFPEVLIIPSNHGLVVSVYCSLSSSSSTGSVVSARITCSGHPETPCVHSTFTDEKKRPSSLKRWKRGIMEARQLLAALDAQRAPYPIGRPLIATTPVEMAVQEKFERKMGLATSRHNETNMLPSVLEDGESKPAEEERADLKSKTPYRVRQKAAFVYKLLYDEGMNSEQMLKALPAVVASRAVRQETEKLIIGLPDSRMLQVISSRQGSSPPAAAKPKYPVPPYVKWLLGSMGSITACLGTSLGSLLCSITSEAAGLPIAVAACHQGGLLHMAGACHVMMGRLFQAVADDNSVICTALHSKGLLEDFPFVVDSSFGRLLEETDPKVLKGYHFMANPVVSLMQKSDYFSLLVQTMSRPWIDQMMFESGYLEQPSFLGRLMLDWGLGVARIVGQSKESIPEACTSWTLISMVLNPKAIAVMVTSFTCVLTLLLVASRFFGKTVSTLPKQLP